MSRLQRAMSRRAVEMSMGGDAKQLEHGSLTAQPSWRSHHEQAAVKNVLLQDAQGIPVREGLQYVYTIYRDKAIKEAIIFTLYFLVFLLISWQIWNVHAAFVSDDTIVDLLIDEEFPDANYKKNFGEIRTFEEVWTWLEGPFAQGMYPNEWYNGQLYDTTQQGYVQNYYRLVGGVRIRQSRVSNTSCEERRFLGKRAIHDGVSLGRFDTKDGSCWGDFSSITEDTRPYGPNGIWSYTRGLDSLDGLIGFGPPGGYGTGGYVVNLPLDRAGAFEKLAFLKRNMFIDRGTRALAIDFNLYNTNTKLVTVSRIVIEVFESAYIVPWYRFYTFRMVLYDAYLDQFRLVGEILYLCFWMYYVQKEARRLYWSKPWYTYFLHFRNVYEVAVLVANFVAIVFWIRFLSNESAAEFDVNDPEYEEMFSLAENFITLFTFIGFICLLNSLKIFKYLGISKKMNALWLTLARASSDLLAFSVGFIVIVLGFALFGNFMFGFILEEFHNVSSSFSTLMRYPLGDFDYSRLSQARPAVAALFFALYVGMVFVVCMNMFIGIVTKYFEEVHDDVKAADRWKSSAKKWEARGLQILLQMYVKQSRRCSCICPKRVRATAEADLTNAEEEKVTLQRESLFMSHLHKCMQAAKRRRNLDLFRYFEALYENEDNSDHLYIGVHEMCSLTSKDPCALNSHVCSASCAKPCPLRSHTTCLAAQLMQAYSNMKMVMMVGNIRRHEPIVVEVETGELKLFEVIKINRNGYKQRRKIGVDVKNMAILNLSMSLRLKKSLPLTQLIQIEKSTTNSSHLGLVFTSTGMKFAHLIDANTLETTYELRFKSPRRRREFIKSLLDALAVLDQKSGSGARGGNPPPPAPSPASSRFGGPVASVNDRGMGGSSPSRLGGLNAAGSEVGAGGIGGGIGGGAGDLRALVRDMQSKLQQISQHLQ